MSDGTASVRLRRRVEWPDTDAAGHYHHSTVIRWVEAAESQLHEELGLPDLFGAVPRVRYEVDYAERLWFRDEVEIMLTVASVGRTSIRYEFEVRRGEALAARGALTAVHLDQESGEPRPWSGEERARLETGRR